MWLIIEIGDVWGKPSKRRVFGHIIKQAKNISSLNMNMK
jgi:hypothetical protein